MNDVTYAFIIISFLLLGVVIVGVYLYFKQSSQLIKPSQCPLTKGIYGSNPGQLGSKILYQCGSNSNQQCSFSSINTLAGATTLCNSYINVCKAFSYSPTTGNVLFIDPSSILGSSSIYDTYILQYNTIGG